MTRSRFLTLLLCALFLFGCAADGGSTLPTPDQKAGDDSGPTHWVEDVFTATIGEDDASVELYDEYAAFIRNGIWINGDGTVDVDCTDIKCTLSGVRASANFSENYWGPALVEDWPAFFFYQETTGSSAEESFSNNYLARVIHQADEDGLSEEMASLYQCEFVDDVREPEEGGPESLEWITVASCAFRLEHMSAWGDPPRDSVSMDLLIDEDLDGAGELLVGGELAAQIEELLEAGPDEEFDGLGCSLSECQIEGSIETSIYSGEGFLATITGKGQEALSLLVQNHPDSELAEIGMSWKNFVCSEPVESGEPGFCHVVAAASVDQSEE